MTPDTLADVEAVVVRNDAVGEPHLLTLLWRSFGMSSANASVALGLLAATGRIERRAAANGFVTYWARQPAGARERPPQ